MMLFEKVFRNNYEFSMEILKTEYSVALPICINWVFDEEYKQVSIQLFCIIVYAFYINKNWYGG